MYETEFVVLGAGLTGLAAASELGSHTVVLEREDRPGGLVRTENFNGYWFDHVIHLLHLDDTETEQRIHRLIGNVLAPCPPDAWIETDAGVTRFPIQTNLNGLRDETIVSCLRDLAAASYGPGGDSPSNFEQLLSRSFGRALCDVFLFPYNRKMWRRPLDTLATADFTWNIATPDYVQVLRGALSGDSGYRPYNAKAWYPRPPADCPIRGMEYLSRALAEGVDDLRLNHTVERICLARRAVVARHDGEQVDFRFHNGCLNTLPLPVAIGLCDEAPQELKRRCRNLPRNRVRTVTFSIRGPRPRDRGLWRYYADESVLFTRLIYMHGFDPLSAPADGWGLMAEVTERAEDSPEPDDLLIERVCEDLHNVGAIPDDCAILDRRVITIDPAYVVFTLETRKVIEQARQFLIQHGITPLGRYGRWEYSSMAQVMRDGFCWAEQVREEQTAGTSAAATMT